MQDLLEYKKFAEELANISSKIIMKYFRKISSIEIKEDNSPVTIADKLSEEEIRKKIELSFPNHGIYGEEFGKKNENAEFLWVIDPIDGTKSFIHGTPLFGTLIALVQNGNPILGVINLPALSQTLIGDNESCLLNGDPVEMRKCDRLDSALLLTTDYKSYGNFQNLVKFNELVSKVKIFRTWGDCYGYYLLASGYADIMIDPIMSPWDTMALIPIIRGANGVITDFFNRDPAKFPDSIIASNNSLYNPVIDILQ